jgi:hypothetical protein
MQSVATFPLIMFANVKKDLKEMEKWNAEVRQIIRINFMLEIFRKVINTEKSDA